MIKVIRGALAAALLGGATGASGAERVVILDVQNVSCATCAPIVKGTLGSMAGVTGVVVDLQMDGSAVATVRYDESKVTPDGLAQATAEAGYPARVRAR